MLNTLQDYTEYSLSWKYILIIESKSTPQLKYHQTTEYRSPGGESFRIEIIEISLSNDIL